MSLPNDFLFSQSNLQDFETCPRRFELRYLRRLSWPAVEAEPIQEAEHLARLGTDFHRLVYQHLIGIDAASLTASLEHEPELKTWWRNYLEHRPGSLRDAQNFPELTLSTPLRGYRLTARFDLLAVQPNGTFLIIDWKTARYKPSRPNLTRRIQTRAYPYVLTTAGTALNRGQAIDPSAIKMMYWYPQEPKNPEIFAYGPTEFQRDEQFLGNMIEQIKNAAYNNEFPLVEADQPCQHCVYRSFCDRGEQAGSVLTLEVEPQEALDASSLEWDQIAEIQF